MKRLSEGAGDRVIVFEFPDQWEALKYDEHGGFYKNFVGKCQGTKAVDFLILEKHRQLWIEVKNFRGDTEANELRLDPNHGNIPGLKETRGFVENNGWKNKVLVLRKKAFLPEEVAQKVRDTCSGLVGATLQDQAKFQPFSAAISNKLPIHIILFLQQDEERDKATDFRRMAQRMADKIRQQLVFLNATVEVVNQFTVSPNAQWRVLGNKS